MSEDKKTTIASEPDPLHDAWKRIDLFHKWAAERGGVQCRFNDPDGIVAQFSDFDRGLFCKRNHGILFAQHCVIVQYPEMFSFGAMRHYAMDVTHAIGLMTAQIQMMLEKPSKINVTTEVRENFTVVRRSCEKGEAEEKKVEQPNMPVAPDDKPSEPFKPGDVVRHKGGDTKMVVIALLPDNRTHALIGLPVNLSVSCRWMQDGEVKRECFSPCELTKLG